MCLFAVVFLLIGVSCGHPTTRPERPPDPPNPPDISEIKPPGGLECVHGTPALYSFYIEAGCKVNTTDQKCVRISDCPTYGECLDSDGDPRAYKEIWHEGNRLCRCAYVSEIYFFSIPKPLNAPPIPAQSLCRLNGCKHGKGTFYSEGHGVTLKDGRDCKCTEGPDENLMDMATLFHWKCDVKSPPEGIVGESDKSQ
ncbi:uncharacterized protein LOC141902683 [Tubulanus polymorphus]|uniref:uncharacterized protein LOC141902683 n=1 Tax=Tubulanus polymorphus TaxID=672921 RepID=UPI003DA24976